MFTIRCWVDNVQTANTLHRFSLHRQWMACISVSDYSMAEDKISEEEKLRIRTISQVLTVLSRYNISMLWRFGYFGCFGVNVYGLINVTLFTISIIASVSNQSFCSVQFKNLANRHWFSKVQYTVHTPNMKHDWFVANECQPVEVDKCVNLYFFI